MQRQRRDGSYWNQNNSLDRNQLYLASPAANNQNDLAAKGLIAMANKGAHPRTCHGKIYIASTMYYRAAACSCMLIQLACLC